MKVFIDLMWFFKQEKKALYTGIIILAMVAFLQLIPPKLVGIIVDTIKENQLTGVILAKWIAVLIIAALAMYVSSLLLENYDFWFVIKIGTYIKKSFI